MTRDSLLKAPRDGRFETTLVEVKKAGDMIQQNLKAIKRP